MEFSDLDQNSNIVQADVILDVVIVGVGGGQVGVGGLHIGG